MVIYASVCKQGTPGLLDLELYSFLLRRTWAADNTGRGHTSIWSFENPNPVLRPSIRKYNRYSVSKEIPVPVSFEPLATPYFFMISMILTSDQLGFLASRNAFTALREISGRLTTVFPADQAV